MKSVICSIIIAVLLLGGCAKRETEVHTKKTEVPAVMQTTEEIEDVKEIEQSYVSDKNNEDEWIAYSEKYGTECRFTDLYVPAKCWLVGDENVVELMSLGGIDDATVINRASIERVEHTNIAELTTISVFDKTGKSISIMLSSEDAEKLLELIK